MSETPRKKDALTVLEEAKNSAVPIIVENLRRATSELVSQPALATKVPYKERKLRFQQVMAESARAIKEGQPDRPGTLGALIRQEQQRWGLAPDEVPLSILDYITSMKEEQE